MVPDRTSPSTCQANASSRAIRGMRDDGKELGGEPAPLASGREARPRRPKGMVPSMTIGVLMMLSPW
jgi:hypothetical protein